MSVESQSEESVLTCVRDRRSEEKFRRGGPANAAIAVLLLIILSSLSVIGQDERSLVGADPPTATATERSLAEGDADSVNFATYIEIFIAGSLFTMFVLFLTMALVDRTYSASTMGCYFMGCAFGLVLLSPLFEQKEPPQFFFLLGIQVLAASSLLYLAALFNPNRSFSTVISNMEVPRRFHRAKWDKWGVVAMAVLSAINTVTAFRVGEEYGVETGIIAAVVGVVVLGAATALAFYRYEQRPRIWLRNWGMVGGAVTALCAGNLYSPKAVSILSALAPAIFAAAHWQKKRGRTWLLASGATALSVAFALSGATKVLLFVPLGLLALAVSTTAYIATSYVSARDESISTRHELEAARTLQASLLPDAAPATAHVHVAWSMVTANQVGGDYYDYSLTDDGTLTLCVGDATGHGMDSGVMVTGTKSLFQTFADAPSITDSLTVMSKSLKGMNMPRMGMAMTFLRLKNQTCTVSSAGMPPVMIYRAGTGAVHEVEVSGFPLGVSATATYQQEVFEVGSGDVILMMSDGLPERLNLQDEYFDYDRTTALFTEAASGAPDEICAALLAGGEEWADGRPQDDDITLVVLKAKQ